MNGSRRTIAKASLSSMRSWSEPDRAANHPCNAADCRPGGHLEFVASIVLRAITSPDAVLLTLPSRWVRLRVVRRPTVAQIEFLGDMDRAGAFTAMPAGLDAALATLESWGLLRGASS
jgi:hypothetical protein